MTDIRPIADQVVVLPDKPAERTSGLLVLPQRGSSDDPCNQHAPCTGTVIAVGPGRQTRRGFLETTVQPGDRILFSRFSGMDKGFSAGGQWHRVLRETEVQAILEPGAQIDGFNELEL